MLSGNGPLSAAGMPSRHWRWLGLDPETAGFPRALLKDLDIKGYLQKAHPERSVAARDGEKSCLLEVGHNPLTRILKKKTVAHKWWSFDHGAT